MVLRDAAFPIRRVRSHPDQLRWVLRSIAYHLPHGRVFIAGNLLPDWVNPETVTFIRTDQYGEKHQNIGENLRAVLDSDISEDFYWFNDDFFILDDMDEIPLMHRDESYDEWYERCKDKSRGDPKAANYFGGMLGQWELLRDLGLPTDTNCDAHVPMPVNRTRLKHILEVIPRHLEGHFRAVYGAGLDSVPVVDPKVKGVEALPGEGWKFVSTSNQSWMEGRCGAWLRNRYFRPSRYER